MSYYHSDDPLFEALTAIVGKEPPMQLKGIQKSDELTEADQTKLYEWCTQNATPHWATGLGVLYAAELLVLTALENDNI